MIGIAAAYRRACALDVAVRKPGNVSLVSAGHRMQAADFIASAEASAAAIAARGACVGARIEAAVRATQEAVGCNTNLGIVLLAAPIAAACERCGNERGEALLRPALAAVLADLDVKDARSAYRAIALARPAGLGRAPQADVAEPPQIGLRAAMALAAGHDRIARQYRDGGAELFDLGLSACRSGAAAERSVLPVYLGFLASAPDSHIVRKQGPAAAQAVTDEAVPWQARAAGGEPLADDPALAAWDESLKARGLNPGTSADLTVATLLLALWLGRIT
ncbi:triphosphoribosyl-dephospho-CoA synthase [Rivibacter subsaxonicus]|uniref:Triphosphoribosyl-dephospho-CoA synthase n=1 Tax=Rivibacter subsaxonicus TaxID=457575 RepID=A0A4Q7W0I0_9BURK|nr:triphosphoribosyl-dephospho-CoA synthase [Rivibacter subsaxonicus]RZU02724.1 triphosphoribosyl-dephospho-CoA synthase [Rivibacter subsaxonicus]